MKTHMTLCLLTLGWILTGAAGASSSAKFDEIIEPYEEIRLLLVHDSIDGVGEYAALIRDTAQAPAGRSESAEVSKLLPAIADSAGDLVTALEIADARDAFYELSKLLVQFRAKISGDDLPAVMYCPMAKRSWLQPEGDVGNPYYGQKMSDCGDAVGK